LLQALQALDDVSTLKWGGADWHTGFDGFDPDDETIPAVSHWRRTAHPDCRSTVDLEHK
jgi:hypothetical protein